MKKRSALALILAAAMFASCAKAEPETEPTETTKETTITTTVEETTAVTTEATTEATTRTTTETTVAATPTPEPEIVRDLCTDYDQYPLFMAKIEEIEASAPGEYRYLILAGSKIALVAIAEDDEQCYVASGGEIIEYDDIVIHDYQRVWARPYEDIVRLPFLVDSANLLRTEYTNEEVRYDQLNTIADSIEDGTYMGAVWGISGDGRSVLMSVCTPVTFDKEEILSLNVGDSIGYEDYVIADIESYEDREGIRIRLSSATIPYADCVYLRDFDAYDSSKLFMAYDDCCVMTDSKIVTVTISSECVITDRVGPHDEGFDDSVNTGNPMFDSYYWYYLNECYPWGDTLNCNNGWYGYWSVATPIVIRDGEVVSMHLSPGSDNAFSL